MPMILETKHLEKRTTLLTHINLPRMDCSSCLVATVLLAQILDSVVISLSLTSSILMAMAIVSNSIPKNFMVV